MSSSRHVDGVFVGGKGALESHIGELKGTWSPYIVLDNPLPVI